MTAPATPAGPAGRETELLHELGLPPSAGPDDLDNLHAAVSEYLAAAPTEIRGWAHAQAAALDAAYLQLTDPAGLEGSALKSPARRPTVAPGGPATPPARRDHASPAPEPAPDEPAAAAVMAEPADASGRSEREDPEADLEDEEALYASVTPSAHRDMLPDAKRTRPSKAPRDGTADVAGPALRKPGGPWKKAVIGAVVAVGIAGIAFAGYTFGGGGVAAQGPAASESAGLTVNTERVGQLMQKLQVDPKDTATLIALADEYYQAQQYPAAGDWLDKVLAIDPKNVSALLARGAVSFNLGDLAAAETTWKQVVGLDPKNVEAHYDLGFLYLNQTPANMAAVKDEWTQVVELGPGTQLAQTVQSHLDSFAAASMLPASPAPGGSPAASPATSPVASPAASPAPGSSAAAGVHP